MAGGRIVFICALFFLVGFPAFAQADTPRPLDVHIVLDAETGTKSFFGFYCTVDCSGHKAGFAWAQKKGLTQEEQCGGRSNSFREGCVAYTRFLQQSAQ